jgi:ATP-binding cassette subfamily F protein 2
MGDLQPNTGRVVRHHHLRCARFHQHMTEQLDPELNPMEYMLKEFPQDLHKDNVRSAIGRFGITGLAQSMPIKFLSDGQKARLAFATIAVKPFQIAFFDEPSNALSIETIDALAAAINAYAGGVVIVSHDFRLIEQVAKEIWVCEDKTIRKYDGSIRDYKRTIRRKLGIPDREEE